VKKVNPDVFVASKALEAWLGLDRIASRLISRKKTLSIEAKALATFYKIKEVQDSKDKAGEGAEMQ
jgi:predicted transcriptional regulator